MSPWITILLGICIPMLVVTVTAVINTKIKFAPTADVANKELKLLALKIVVFLSAVMTLVFLAMDFSSSEPVTRFAVFTISFRVGSFVFIILMYSLTQVMELIGGVIETNRLTARHFDTLINVVDKQR